VEEEDYLFLLVLIEKLLVHKETMEAIFNLLQEMQILFL
jgi:hypothetical protein